MPEQADDLEDIASSLTKAVLLGQQWALECTIEKRMHQQGICVIPHPNMRLHIIKEMENHGTVNSDGFGPSGTTAEGAGMAATVKIKIILTYKIREAELDPSHEES